MMELGLSPGSIGLQSPPSFHISMLPGELGASTHPYTEQSYEVPRILRESTGRVERKS